MKTKQKTVKVDKATAQWRVPRLRFPEFRENWCRVELGKCFKNIGGTALEKYVTNHGTHHFISIGNYSIDGFYIDKGQRIEINEATKSKLLNKNDLVMVLNDKTSAGDIIGSTLLIDENDRYIYNQRSERLIIDSDLTPVFAWHLLNSQVVRKEVFKRSQGGTQIYVNFPSVKAIKLAAPNEPKEQQKIADCLTSIDELITAQAQKIDTLKTYKKGLMQQLFPAQGETVPKLRFPEFRNAGAWEKHTLVQMATFRRGSFPQPYGLPEWYDDTNGMPFIQVFDVNDDLRLKPTTKRKISKLAAEQSVFIPKGTLIVTIQGSIGRVAVTQYDAYIDRTLLLFKKFHKPTEKLFFAYVIQNLFEVERKKAPGGIIKTITKKVLSNFKIKSPTLPEQQKIADCLSSLDDLITAQTQKLDTLKAHKKGLMQQLFPPIDEVNG